MVQPAQAVSGSSLITVTAPSGAGKSSLLAALIQADSSLRLSVSHTTRQPRPGEQNGREYHFTTVDDFKKRLKEGEFLEHAEVHGNFYGTSRVAVLNQLNEGYDTILEIDWQGAHQIRRLFPETVSIFILPPSREVLLERLRGRGTETEEQIGKRFGKAQAEMELADQYDYSVVNDDLTTAVAQVRQMIEKS